MNIFSDFNEDEELAFEASIEPEADLFIATFEQFRELIRKMNRLAKNEASFLFRKLHGSHWIFQRDVRGSDDVDCAIVKVAKGKVYAISYDVKSFVKKVLKKFDI